MPTSVFQHMLRTLIGGLALAIVPWVIIFSAAFIATAIARRFEHPPVTHLHPPGRGLRAA